MRICSACGRKKIEFTKSLLLGFGFSIKCSSCGSRVKLNILAQSILYVFLGLLTVILLVVLTDNFGIIGFVLAFIIPLVLDFIAVHYIPLEVIEKGDGLT
jgi:hypothetical protein